MWFARGGNSEYGKVGSRQNGVVVRWGGNADEGILYGVVMGGGGRKGMVGEGGGVGEKRVKRRGDGEEGGGVRRR